jgi:hypothetical protein
MSINGLRNPASSALPPPVAHGSSEVDTNKPAPGMLDAHRTALPDRPPQHSGEAVASPRIVLSKLGAVQTEPAVDAFADTTQAIATKVLGDVASGKLTLLASHSAISLTAAASAAAKGVMALRNDL